MNFRKRLIIAFFIMTLFPMLLLISLGAVILKYQSVAIRQDYEVEVDGIQMIQNPIHLLNRLTRGIYNELQTVSSETPEKLLDETYLEDTDSRLRQRQAFLVVRKEGTMVFCGNPEVYDVLTGMLPEPGMYTVVLDGGLYISGRIPCLVKQHGFIFSDGTEGTVLVISDVSTVMPQLKNSLFQVGCGCLLIFLVTGSLAVFWLYSGVVKPINQLKHATKRVKEGDLNFHLQKTGEDEIGELSEDFEEMRAHLKDEIDARVKYEEDLRNLIGNISHDLKTPLTSIINYVNLIKREQIDNEKVQGYLEILEQKSSRLKTLTEDLVEASKVSSGNVNLIFAKLNIVELLNQTMGEFEEKFEEKGLQIVATYEQPCIYIWADSRRIWRVMENLFGNIYKYAMENTRVYVDVIRSGMNTKEEQVELSIKNISAKPLNIDASQLTERFIRGDVSRTTEGSGLGLSIAKDLTRLQKGDFRIYLDGDLFKVTVSFPIYNEASR